jgi:hypothetical protein
MQRLSALDHVEGTVVPTLRALLACDEHGGEVRGEDAERQGQLNYHG